MAKCPRCGGDVSSPRKSWKMAGRPDRNGKRTELTIGLFDCCGKASEQSWLNARFRVEPQFQDTAQ